jgi:hypothetical protein
MRTGLYQRAILAIMVGLGLIAAVVIILSFVDATAMIENSKRCGATIWKLQWPKYVGCTMGAHEGLAGGLIGAAGALFAGWLAYAAVQGQIAAERDLREQQRLEEQEKTRRQQTDAKEVAIVSISPAIRGAAVAMLVIDQSIASPFGSEQRVNGVLKNLREMMDSFAIRESVRDLAVNDRIRYLEIIGVISNLLSVSEYGASSFPERLKVLRSGFAKLHDMLKRFDDGLAQEFANIQTVVGVIVHNG